MKGGLDLTSISDDELNRLDICLTPHGPRIARCLQ